MNRRGPFDWQIPCQLDAPSIGWVFCLLSSRDKRIGTLEAVLGDLLPQFVAFPADPNRVLPQLGTECLLDEQNRLAGRDVDVIEQPLEAPAHTLAGHPEGFVDLLAVCALEHMGLLKLKGIILRIDGEVNAFGVAAFPRDDMGSLHFEKADAGIKGLYQYFDRECARRLFHGYTYINKESDMGIPGLAKAKLSYHPAMRVKSYKLTLR